MSEEVAKVVEGSGDPAKEVAKEPVKSGIVINVVKTTPVAEKVIANGDQTAEAKEEPAQEVKDAPEKEEVKEEPKKEEPKIEEPKIAEVKEEPKKEEVKEEEVKEEPKNEEVKEVEKDDPMEEVKEEKQRGSSRYGRVRKKVQQYVCAEPKEEKELEVADGVGVPLGDIPNCVLRMLKIKNGESILRKLHHLVFPGQRCKKTTVKRQLRQFCGFGPDEDREDLTDSTITRLSKMLMSEIKLICEILDIEHVGLNKDDILPLIVNFLFDPQPSGNPFRFGPKKKKKKTPKKKKSTKKKKPKGPKRPMSGYMLMSQAKRDEIKEKYPDMKVTEQMKLLGQMWKSMSEEDKQPWLDKSEKAKEKFREDHPELFKKKKTPKKKTPKKKTPKKTTPKKRKKAQEGTESEDESSSDEEPLAKKKKGDVEQQIKDQIISILKEGDLDTLSVKKIRNQLKEKFGEEPVRELKAMIKEFINSELEKL